jgi:hypothetical protein
LDIEDDDDDRAFYEYVKVSYWEKQSTEWRSPPPQAQRLRKSHLPTRIMEAR